MGQGYEASDRRNKVSIPLMEEERATPKPSYQDRNVTKKEDPKANAKTISSQTQTGPAAGDKRGLN